MFGQRSEGKSLITIYVCKIIHYAMLAGTFGLVAVVKNNFWSTVDMLSEHLFFQLASCLSSITQLSYLRRIVLWSALNNVGYKNVKLLRQFTFTFQLLLFWSRTQCFTRSQPTKSSKFANKRQLLDKVGIQSIRKLIMTEQSMFVDI